MRELLTTGARLSGAWVTLDDTVVAQAMGRAGFDVVCIDLQHGYASEASSQRERSSPPSCSAHPLLRQRHPQLSTLRHKLLRRPMKPRPLLSMAPLSSVIP